MKIIPDENDATIDAVIPTCRPDERFLELIGLLSVQTVHVRRVHVINTQREGLDRLLERNNLSEKELLRRHPFLSVEHIAPEQFDHGATRNRGFRSCTGADYVLAMTQDALPRDEHLVENLLRPMMEGEEAGQMAVSYARQLPNRNASCEERISREFNYPDITRIKSEQDRDVLGVKTYFCSNVCALYRMSIWREQGGFPDRAIFNEDMVYAGKVLKAGYRICYEADACVYHSHSYSASQQFHRNFDLGVSQAQNPQIFACVSSEGEGAEYVRTVCRRLRKEHRAFEIPGFIGRCCARYAGYRMGKSYRHLPRWLIVRCSMNRNFWNHPDTQGEE